MSEPLLKRFTNFDLYTGANESWLVSNALDRRERSFFRGVFSRSGLGPREWKRRGAYYVDDGNASRWWDKVIAGTRISVALTTPGLPPVERPDRHERSLPLAVHHRAARPVKDPIGWLPHAGTRRGHHRP